VNLLSYCIDGEAKYGIVSGDAVVDLSIRVGGTYPTLKDVLANGALGKLEDLAGESADHALDQIEFALPIPNADKILCAGRNYRAYHEVVEDGGPKYPSIFPRLAHSFAPHQQALLVPKMCANLDYEGELVAVIGTTGKHIAVENALNHVAGYTIMNEGSVRKWERSGTQNFPNKNFDCCGSLGPWMVTADEIPDPGSLRLSTRRNGEVVQDGTTDLMIFDLPYLIAHISSFLTLNPGDLIATGSPGGSIMGSENPNWLRAGENMEFEISNIGVLRNHIVDE